MLPPISWSTCIAGVAQPLVGSFEKNRQLRCCAQYYKWLLSMGIMQHAQCSDASARSDTVHTTTKRSCHTIEGGSRQQDVARSLTHSNTHAQMHACSQAGCMGMRMRAQLCNGATYPSLGRPQGNVEIARREKHIEPTLFQWR